MTTFGHISLRHVHNPKCRFVWPRIVLAIAVSVCTTTSLAQTTSWLGNISSDWHDVANWSNGIPTASTSVIISEGIPDHFDTVIGQPVSGDTARTGSLTLQNKGHIRLDPVPAPGTLIVHGRFQVLNGGGIFVRSGRVDFLDDVRINNGGALDCGDGTVIIRGKRFDLATGGTLIVEGSTTITAGTGTTSFGGDMQLSNLTVANTDSLIVLNNLHVTGVLTIAVGRTVFVKCGGLLTVDGPVVSEGTIVYEAALPVQLTTFNALATANGVTLQWTTSTEANNAGWEAERRVIADLELPNSNWQVVGFVAGAGTSTWPCNYSYTDYAPGAGRYAYRLRQIDRDGTHSLSWESEVEVRAPSAPILEPNYPNPFNPSTIFSFVSPVDGEATLTVFDLTGRVVSVVYQSRTVPGQYVRILWDASGVASGVYVARLRVGESVLSRRIALTR